MLTPQQATKMTTHMTGNKQKNTSGGKWTRDVRNYAHKSLAATSYNIKVVPLYNNVLITAVAIRVTGHHL